MKTASSVAQADRPKNNSLSETRFFRAGDAKSTWRRYCSFLDLSLEEFTQIQGHLLREQIDLVADTVVGKELLQGRRPATVDEFRRIVPLTSYKDYAPYLNDQKDECFAKTEHTWIQTSAQGGIFKRDYALTFRSQAWYPYVEDGHREQQSAIENCYRWHLGTSGRCVHV